jgi:zinc/manganese transport system ATP-binding protein
MHHPILELRDVSFTYGNEVVLERLNITIREGAFVGIVGPSGAGKSTLLRLMDGATKPTSGTVLLGPEGRSSSIRLGVVPQLETIDWNFPITVEEVVLLGGAADAGLKPWASKEVREDANSLLEKLGIGDLARRHIRNLSGGQQQRAFIARALLRKPDLLLLDEPTSGVDVKTRHDVLHLLHTLNHEGIAIAITTHDLNAVAAHLPSLICLNRRVVAAGTPDEVLRVEVLRELYGADMLVVRQDGMLLVGDVPSAFREEHARAGHPEGIAAAHFGEEPPEHSHGAGAEHQHPPVPAREERT